MNPGPYVWGAYLVCAVALAGELIGLWLGRRQTENRLRDAALVDELARRDEERS